MPQAAQSQTTPEPVTVEGTDIFAFGASDQVKDPGPGTTDPTSATPAPPAGHPGDATTAAETPPAETKPDTKPTTRFKSHEEAERGYREAQGTITRTQQENAELKRRLSEVESSRKSAAETAAQQQQREQADQAIETFARARNKEALKEIEALDPDDAEHQDKVAGVWARANTDLIKYSRNPLDKDGNPILGKTAAAAAPEGEPQSAPAPAPAGSPPPAAPATADAPAADATEIERRRAERRDYINERVRTAGIDPEDPLWIGMSLSTPSVDANGSPIPLDEQIQWTIDKHNEYLAQRRAASRASADMPIDRGGVPPRAPQPPGASPGPISLGDAIARSNERRRL